MKNWQWGFMMFVLCNIDYHVSGEDLMPLIAGTIFMVLGVFMDLFERAGNAK